VKVLNEPSARLQSPGPLQRFSQSWKSAALTLAIGLVLLFCLPRVLDDFTLVQATIYVVMSILAVSLGFIWGYGGILCFGQSAFFGLGAYTYAIAVTNLGDSTVPFVLAIVVPAVFAAALGYIIFYGRLSDVYMGVITLTVTLILFNLINSTAGPEWKIGVAPLGGFNGIPNIAPLNMPGNVDDVIGPRGLFELSLGMLLLVYLLLRALLAV
jgi:branched-chain amino acid transport system permease protein